MSKRFASAATKVLVSVLGAVAVFGCQDTTKQASQQLGRVAKDWCLTIRASQVIPVYPLSEDVEVGDVYLVRTRIEDQVQVYEDEGFLPLENLVARLPVVGYADFYRGGYLIDDNAKPPRHWQFPPSAPGTQPTAYASAPRAAFPTYGFKVSRGEGASVAVPVHGVPVGLSLLNAATGSGTIAITESYTYGLPLQALEDAANAWAAKNREFLERFAPVPGTEKQPTRYHYLRVINRVYLAGRVDVSLAADQVSGGEARAGAGAGVAVPAPARDDPAASLAALNEQLAKNIPAAAGGSLKATAASARTIALTESFPRPLVFGYIGFDLRIEEGGQLGPPVPTQQRLERPNSVLPAKSVTWTPPDDSAQRIEKFLNADLAANRKVVRAWLDAKNQQDLGITNFLQGREHAELRRQFVQEKNLSQ